MTMASCCYIPVSLAMVKPAISWAGTMRGIYVHLLDNLPDSPEKETAAMQISENITPKVYINQHVAGCFLYSLESCSN
ncbi:hypothetical protein P167DRAFT_42885 [Morchella conica CCBAS932]|uniref:Uncharacterized protein n=1 Tax=Morchella conica CCBAS932 TaxID=1392247 RepID=A0A3N4KZQ1_9PEZI|nr:hypothetical protein P167DRAFT_42885 [Morchella conica CCBAS932]